MPKLMWQVYFFVSTKQEMYTNPSDQSTYPRETRTPATKTNGPPPYAQT